MKQEIGKGKCFVKGIVKGYLVVSNQPLSFWGGFNPKTGEIIDRRHDLSGETIAGKIFAFPSGCGSSTTSTVLLEAARCLNNPTGIINIETEPILVIGAIVAKAFYSCTIPILTVSASLFEQLRTGDQIILDATNERIFKV